MHAKKWTVEIVIDEHDDERRAHAEARLRTEDRTRLRGEGQACRNPADRPEIGAELAAARALSDLAHRLLDAAADDIESLTRPPARLSG